MQDMNAVNIKNAYDKTWATVELLKTESTAYCFADGKLCYAVDFNGTKYLLESNLSQLEEQLQPNNFYRINRHLLVNIEAVKKYIPGLRTIKIRSTPCNNC